MKSLHAEELVSSMICGVMMITSEEGFYEPRSRRWERKIHAKVTAGLNQHTNRKFAVA